MSDSRKLAVFIILCFVSMPAMAQWTDSFSYTSWQSIDKWKGDTTYYTLELGQLRSNSDSVNHEFQITRSFALAKTTEWEWWMNLKFNTSSANYTDVYLFSDSSNLIKGRSGYFVRIGGTKDEVCLYRTKAGGTPALLIDGRDNLTNNSNSILKIRVLRNDTGLFEVFTDFGATGVYYKEGTAADTILTQSKCFGISIKQSTSAFHKKHYFDNIYAGPLRTDTFPPVLESWTFASDSQVSFSFSEKVYLDSFSDYHAKLLGESNLISSLNGNGTKDVILSLNQKFVQLKNYNLKLIAFRDNSGNFMADTILSFKFLMPVTPTDGQILITEIMADPDPLVGLPNTEYIEIVNRHFLPIQLSGCTFADPTKVVTFPEFVIEPGEWVIICDITKIDSFKLFGRALGLTGMPALNNSGDEIWLKDSTAKLLQHIKYSDKWYRDEVKKTGGWSLEIIDTAGLECLKSFNWTSSKDPSGGTPGNPNSVLASNPDLKAPKLSSYSVNGDSTITLQFDEWMDSISVYALTNYFSNDIIVVGIVDYQEEFFSFTLRFDKVFPKGKNLKIEVTGLKDCSGNASIQEELIFLLPEMLVTGDVVLNEILFNPKDDGVDYIELYNRSKKILDISSFKLANRSKSFDLSNIKTVADTLKLFYPGTYLLLTSDPESVSRQFPVKDDKVFLKMSALPVMSNESGNILLLDESLKNIDSLFYDEKMHFVLLNDFEGVSLERIDFTRSSEEWDNWMSAASSVGYGTPGIKNSQFRGQPDGSEKIVIEPEVFSPDGDGYNDALIIKLNSLEIGSVLNVMVYDVRGRLIKQLANNELTGDNNIYIWDGINAAGGKALVGIYVLYADVFDLKGNTEILKKVFTLGGNIGN